MSTTPHPASDTTSPREPHRSPAGRERDPQATPTSTSPDPQTPQIGEGARRHAEVLRRRVIACAPPTLVVMALSMVPTWQFTGWQWVVALLALPVVTWGAWPFHSAAWRAGRHGSTTMDTLVSLGVIASTLWSWWALLAGGAGELGMRMQMSLIPRASGHHAEIYFEGACTIVLFLLIGRWAEARTRYRAGDALRSLLELGAKEATRLRTDAEGSRHEERIPAAELAVGDLFLVRPGEKVATDGRVVEGSSALDTSLLTGESVPVDVSEGDDVTGATVNTWGALVVRATRVGSETTLAQIGRMVTDAQAGKAPVQRLADRISSVFVPVVIVISLVTLAGWLLAGGGVQAAFTAAVAVLVVACPCALGLATPTALLVGSGRASQLGIVIKSAEILEQTRTIDTMVLDKTGTLTTGRMSLESVLDAQGRAHPAGVGAEVAVGAETGAAGAGTGAAGTGASQQSGADGRLDPEAPTIEDATGIDEGGAPGAGSARRALALAAGTESGSEHPLARAVVTGARQAGLDPARTTSFTSHPGLGVSAVVAGAKGGQDLVLVGRPKWVRDLGIEVPDPLERAVGAAQDTGASVVVVATVPDWREKPGDPVGTPGEAGGLGEQMAGGGETAAGGTAPDAAAPIQAGPGLVHIDMDVQGMTCASCVRRVERKLQKLPGVHAAVNLATESAAITLDHDYSDAELEKVVDDAGYHATVRRRSQTRGAEPAGPAEPASREAASRDAATAQEASAPGTTDPGTTSPAPSTARVLPDHLPAGQAVAALVVRDTPKPTSAEAVAELRGLGIEPILLTGDNEASARHVAREVGIDRVIAQVMPDQKRDVVRDLQEQGHVVAMVGDGVNDAAALAQAGVKGLGIAMGSGTDVAIEVADITLVNSEPRTAATAIRISRRTLRVIKQNLFWAFAYNVAMIPLAVAGLLNPMLAAAAMAFSSVFVVVNSLRLRRAS